MRSAARTPEFERMATDFRKKVVAAAPGDALYVPNPYPRTVDQMVENFRDTYFGHLHDVEAEVPAKELEVYQKLKSGQFEVRVARVENWTPNRCLLDRPAPFYRLLRFFDADSGVELLQASQHESGHTAVLSNPYPGRFSMPDLEAVPDLVRRAGLAPDVSDIQYVASGGLPWRCTPELPCIAFRSPDSTFLLTRGRPEETERALSLYRVAPDARRGTAIDYRDALRRRGLGSLGPHERERPLVTLGFTWAEAELVGELPDRRP